MLRKFITLTAISLSTFGIACLPTMSLADINDGLVAYYPFDGNADDMSGNGNVGIPYGVTYVDGVIGQAAHFDGINDYVRVAQSSTLVDLQTMTLTYWVKYYKPVSGAGDVSTTVCNGHDSKDPADAGFFTYAATNGVNHRLGIWGAGVGVGTPINAKPPLSEQNYAFVTFLVTEQKVQAYRNAELTHEADREGEPISRPARDWYIGQNGLNGYYLNGIIDDVRIYNRPLAQEEIEEIYTLGRTTIECNSFSPPLSSGLVTLKSTKRPLPIKAELYSEESTVVSDGDIESNPVVFIYKSDESYPFPVTPDLDEFTYQSGAWRYTLEASQVTEPGEYITHIFSGDHSKYVIQPTCSASFVIP